MAWISNEEKKRKIYLRAKDMSERITWATEVVDVMGLGCCCKVVDGGSVDSRVTSLSWISNKFFF